MLHSTIKQSIVLRSIWFSVTVVLFRNLMGKLCQETKLLIGRWGTDSFSKASNFPFLLSKYKRFPKSTWSGLGLKAVSGEFGWQNELLAPPPIFLFLFLTLSPASSPFVLLVELFAQYHWKTGCGFDSDGKKWEKLLGKPLLVCVSRWISSPVSIIMWLHTCGLWGWYMGENKWSPGQLKFSWHWRWSHKLCYPDTKGVAITGLRRCVSELTLFPASKDKLHWVHWRCVWQQRAIIWWGADPGWSSSCCVWNSANKREGAKNGLETCL